MKLDINYINSFEALLFDLDGTLVDSMNLHNKAWISTIKEQGHLITPDILFEYAGVANHIIVEELNKRFDWNLNPTIVVEEKEQRFLNNLHQVKPIDAVESIVRKFSNKKSMAIVSGGNRQTVMETLDAILLKDFFNVIVCAGDTNLGKPFPDPFLRAAELLSVKPEKCLVFEDGEAGIQGALQANMNIIKVNADHSLQRLSN